MIRLRGAEAEGNLIVRAMFENPNVTTIGAAIEQQYVWLGLIIFGLLCLRLLKQEQRIHSRRLRELVQTLCTVAVFLVWLFAVLRLFSGAVGNLLQIAAAYGMGAQVMVVAFGSAAIFVAVALDIWLSARRKQSPESQETPRHGRREWYDNQAMLEVIQAYGRAVRVELLPNRHQVKHYRSP
jgi:hypothetical protein